MHDAALATTTSLRERSFAERSVCSNRCSNFFRALVSCCCETLTEVIERRCVVETWYILKRYCVLSLVSWPYTPMLLRGLASLVLNLEADGSSRVELYF